MPGASELRDLPGQSRVLVAQPLVLGLERRRPRVCRYTPRGGRGGGRSGGQDDDVAALDAIAGAPALGTSSYSTRSPAASVPRTTSPKATKTSSPPASGRTKYVGLSAGLSRIAPRRRSRPVGLHQLGGLHVMRDGALAVHRRHVRRCPTREQRARSRLRDLSYT